VYQAQAFVTTTSGANWKLTIINYQLSIAEKPGD
jgi:hypothetical protein